jgi:hypothetical protein
MSKNGDERRRWQRIAIERAAELKANGTPYPGTTTDISAGGASLEADIEALGDVTVEISIDEVGEYNAAVVRQWDTGMALIFDIDEDDQYELQEELEAFRRENEFDLD